MPLNIRSEEVNQLADALARRTHMNKTDAVKLALQNELRRLDQALPAEINTVPISVQEAEAALDAFARYDTGRGHPAHLNLGDCFAYACAKTNRTPLLFKGDGFSRTDIAPGAQQIAPPE